MKSTNFPETNCYFGPPPDMEDSQVSVIQAYQGIIAKGSCEGAPLIVTAWKPDAVELSRLNAGEPVFLSFLGGLPPHFVTTNFAEATNPA